MSAKTKIVVFQMKELIYTAIFVVLGILFILLFIFMFLPKEKAENPSTETTSPYVAGVYTSSICFHDQALEVEVIVDKDHINSVRLINLNETVTTMYPLIQPSFEDLAHQIITNQSLENVTYPDESKYTSMILLDAITTSLNKALENEGDTDTSVSTP